MTQKPGFNAALARKNILTGRQRWLDSLHFRPVDRPVNIEFGYWDETLVVWHQAGLPANVANNDDAHSYFGFDHKEGVYSPIGLNPDFEYKLLREDAEYRDFQTNEGQIIRVHKEDHGSIPQFLRFPIQDRADWNEFKKRLDPDDPVRFPDPVALKKRYEGRDYPIGMSAGSLFGCIRNWMGFENACMLPHLDPVWFEEMVEQCCSVSCTVLERYLSVMQYDYVDMWEDMAFKQGPMMNPEHFERFMVPRYRRITDLCHKYGVDIIYLDCDGNIDVLVPLWLKAGVNGMFPLEVACGSDPVKYRKLYGKDVLLIGGVNKRELAKDHAAIDAELARLRPLIDQGGFIPHVDHRCPPDVSFDNYLYYLAGKLKVFGMV